MSYSTDLLEAIISFYDANHLHYDVYRQHGIVLMNDYPLPRQMFPNTPQIQEMQIMACIGKNNLSFQFVAPTFVDPTNPDAMRRTAEYLNRANGKIATGSFILNWDQGAAYFQSPLACGEFVPPDSVITDVFYSGLAMWAVYGDGYLRVALTGANPAEQFALAQSE